MFTEIAAPKETPTASAGINAQSLLLHRPATSVVGLGARAALVDSALRFAGFTITRHPAGYRLIVLERGRA